MTVFEERLRAAQMPLLNYIGALCCDPQAAEDILGETNLKLVREQAAYDAARPLLPWARTIAWFEVRAWRSDQRRSRVVCDEGLTELMAADLRDESRAEEEADGLQRRLDCLKEAQCELTPEMRYLVTRHYVYGDSLTAIGFQLSRTAESVAASLYHIRKVLRKSVLKKIGRQHED